jgi:hypothetical protein
MTHAGEVEGRSARADPLLRRRWPTVAGIVTVPALLATGLFDDFVDGVVFAAALYLAWGVFRHRPGQGAWVLLQIPGVLVFGAVTLWALSLDDPGAQYVLAAGWLAHAAWDVVHFRANRVVARWWSEWCLILDVLLAAVLVIDASL